MSASFELLLCCCSIQYEHALPRAKIHICLLVSTLASTLLHDRYLRGGIQPVSHSGLSSRHAKRSHFEQYRRTRQKALAVWLETVGVHDGFVASAPNTIIGDTTEQGWRHDNDDRDDPCLFWFAGKWHCAIARWYNSSEKKQLKVPSVYVPPYAVPGISLWYR